MKAVRRYDTVVIGAGAAGMAAAATVAGSGFTVALIDREESLGGILLQCIHNGFGLHQFGTTLTGPEYAEAFIDNVNKLQIDIYCGTTVVDLSQKNTIHTVVAYSAKHGVLAFEAKTVILAMGCRERNRGSIGIPGYRPSGIFTAGLAQRLLNVEGYLPGKRVVIVGSGDIGLIMARRMTWVGASVLAVIEIQPHPSGLTRNIVQCLHDFNIPLYLSHVVTNIIGADRVERVEVTPLENGIPAADKSFVLDCDTILLSVGLLPENELSRKAGVAISHNTGGAIVDHTLQTTVPGIYACGNVLHVHDLVDFVTDEAVRCGNHVVAHLNKSDKTTAITVAVETGANCKYVVPNRCSVDNEQHFFMRSLVVRDKAELVITQGDFVVRTQTLRYVRPAEMLSITLTPVEAAALNRELPLTFSLR